MNKYLTSLNTPIVFLIFNRPDTTARVFAEIKRAKPRQLFIIADGPRSAEESEKCERTRGIIDQVDWECQVYKNYSESNQGCGKRVSSGLTWVFEQVEEAIILEDDCLPDPSFFQFCQDMLTEYRYDERIMHVGGTNLTPQPSLKASYLFCRFMPIWGWATWRRAWQKYDYNMTLWPEYKQTKDLDYFQLQKITLYKTFEEQWKQSVDTWDIQWWFSCLVSQGLGVVPKTNLVTNIGFRADATHTSEPNHMSNVSTESLQFPLIQPSQISTNPKFDKAFLDFCWGKKTNEFIRKLKSIVRVRSRIQRIVQASNKQNLSR